jgi:hypothetical protein
MGLGVEAVVDGGVSGEEALGGTLALYFQLLPLSPAYGMVLIFRPVGKATLASFVLECRNRRE